MAVVPASRHPYTSITWLRAQLVVMGVTLVTVLTLLVLGCGLSAALAAALAAATGGAEISCRLTGTFPAPWIRVTVLVLILVLVVVMTGAGQQPVMAATVALAAAATSAEAARRIAGRPSPAPGLPS